MRKDDTRLTLDAIKRHVREAINTDAADRKALIMNDALGRVEWMFWDRANKGELLVPDSPEFHRVFEEIGRGYEILFDDGAYVGQREANKRWHAWTWKGVPNRSGNGNPEGRGVSVPPPPQEEGPWIEVDKAELILEDDKRPSSWPPLPVPSPGTECCRNGHPRNEENSYISPSGRRECRACKRARSRRAGKVHEGAPE